ncbi:MAG: hypothetical protein GEU91_08855 [Rhizobiales bacterium]|nr:hypothetical protein [Hyphomicrobiales bacterium]
MAVWAMIAAAHAASDEAWDEFRKSVEITCLEAAAADLDGAKATVDPFGSQSFGLALLQGRPKGGNQPVMMICVYDKKTRNVELGGEIEARPP